MIHTTLPLFSRSHSGILQFAYQTSVMQENCARVGTGTVNERVMVKTRGARCHQGDGVKLSRTMHIRFPVASIHHVEFGRVKLYG